MPKVTDGELYVGNTQANRLYIGNNLVGERSYDNVRRNLCKVPQPRFPTWRTTQQNMINLTESTNSKGRSAVVATRIDLPSSAYGVYFDSTSYHMRFIGGITYTITAVVQGTPGTFSSRIRLNPAGTTNALAQTYFTTTGNEELITVTYTPANDIDAAITMVVQGDPIGTEMKISDVMVSASSGPYFDGGHSPDPKLIPSWTGAVNNSESVLVEYAWGEPNSNPDPAPTPGWVPNPSNGTGGLRGDYTNVSYTDSQDMTSQYHIYAAHLTGDGPFGIIYALHGDGAGWFNSPTASVTMNSVRQMARDRNMILVIPRTPDQVAPLTWWETFAHTTWLANFHSWTAAIHNIDRNKIHWFGYSGGAEVQTYSLMSAYSSRWTGGSSIMVAGGGKTNTTLYAPISEALRTPYRNLMHWVVGALDNPADGGDDGGFDAVQASINGEARYREIGLPTKLTIVPGKDHYNILSDGVAALEERLGPIN